MLKLIVGLGNPGIEYQKTRHNVGFWYVEALTRKYKLELSTNGKFFGLTAQLKSAKHDVWLLNPQTYMNLSGKAVAALMGFYKILPAQILVIHDELDFEPGVARLKFGGGNGGHNGLKDIDRVIGNQYWRLRVGIGHPGDKDKVTKFVLNQPPVDELIAINLQLDQVLSISDTLIHGDFAAAQRKIHTSII